MFGLFGGNKFERMAKKGNVNALGQYSSTPKADIRMQVVKALGNVVDNTDAGNALVVYLRDPDRQVQLEAVKSMGKIGVSAHATHLNTLRTQAQKEGDSELEKAANEALQVLRERLGK